MFKTIVALSGLEQWIFFLVAGVYRLYFFHEPSTNWIHLNMKLFSGSLRSNLVILVLYKMVFSSEFYW